MERRAPARAPDARGGERIYLEPQGDVQGAAALEARLVADPDRGGLVLLLVVVRAVVEVRDQDANRPPRQRAPVVEAWPEKKDSWRSVAEQRSAGGFGTAQLA